MKLRFRVNKLKITIFSAIALLLIIIIGVAVIRINDWFETHRFQFNKPVEVRLNPPVEIVERQAQVREIVRVIEELPTLDNLTPIEQYICDKWGVFDCRIALAVSKAENGTRQPDRFNVNTNGTIDIGIFQINSVHFKREGCSLAEIVDAYKNVDCAYQIWQEQGWNPWVAFNNGNFADNL